MFSYIAVEIAQNRWKFRHTFEVVSNLEEDPSQDCTVV